MFIYTKKLSENKALEISGLRFYCPGTIFDTELRWSTQSSMDDHWGFFYHLCLFNYMIIEFNIYDIRHQDDDE